jgi:hypothetical protein
MLLAFATMSDGVTLTGTLDVVAFVLPLASFGTTWWLAYRAIRRAPKSRLSAKEPVGPTRGVVHVDTGTGSCGRNILTMIVRAISGPETDAVSGHERA